MQFPNGVLTISAGKKRLFSSTSWLFIGWTIGSSLILFLIALIFIQRQVRPIRRLSVAARQLGLGRDITEDFQLEGAREIRSAGRAFQAMRHRIKRHLNERTTMLAGVSHDLRTPLTRMRLQLALVKKTPEIEELTKDISEMEAMIETYLAFSRGEVSDPPHQGDIRQLLRDITEPLQKSYPDRLTLIFNEDDIPEFPIRASSLRRALMNILENALRYAENAEIRVRRREDTLLIQIDDDGPGIPLERRAEAILPFKRLEASRNQQTGGTGLGLSIASDIILSHGGQLELLDSRMGGLRVYVILPI
jgi:two-component system osmolarity sensor histidine kinase EnvZ